MAEQDGTQPEKGNREKDFFPKGAIAFMVAMVLAYGAIWLFFYLLMLGRA